MTDPISNERLAEMLAEVEIEFDNALSDAEADQNPQLAVDPVGEFDLIELRSILTELQSRRSSSVKPSAILSQIALWSDDEGLELSMGQGDDLARRIMSVVRAAGISEQMLVDAFIRGESWRKRNDVDRYVAVPEMVAKAARDYADYVLPSLSVKEPEGVEYVRADGNSFDALMSAGDDLLRALERYGFPVSAAATAGLMDRGSIEAQRLHRAALGFRDAMSKEPHNG